jgi:undecaprenyl-diphosphatase
MTTMVGKGVPVPRQLKMIGMTALPLIWLSAFLLGGPGAPLDRSILSLLYAGDHPSLARGAAILTDLGGWAVLLPLSLAGAAILLARRGIRDAVLLLLIALGGRWLVEMQKLLIARARPEEHHLVDVHSLSFPSGHAANSMLVFLGLALLLTNSRAAVVSALLLSFAIGLSRIVLGVHFPSDVLGGWAFALLWILLLLRFRLPADTAH